MKKPRRIREVECPHCKHWQIAMRKERGEPIAVQQCYMCMFVFNHEYHESRLVEAPAKEHL